ncbi:GAF domain-containing protein [Deinococcus alpinitundrae]|uniref:GAF domain-containing protein n=1 Tax=Deinococcus alpinitundrae TaxID=468913 RepID=UPI001379D8C2|nr:GAF domain-containing protein [Deinococcus alpinitundrae]
MISPPGGTDSESLSTLTDYIQEITEALAATSTQRGVLEIVLTPAVEALGAVAGIVLLVDQNDQQMKIAGSQGYEDITRTIWQEGSLSDNQLITDILRMRQALYFEHAGALKAAYPEIESRTGGVTAAANAVLPMFLDEQPLGVIVLDFSQPHEFTPAEQRFLTILSNQCAVALGRAQATRTLEARVEERIRQLEERTLQLQQRTQQLEEEQAALEIFVAFTEAVGSQTNVDALVRQAIALLEETCDVEVAYVEREGELFKATIWNPSADPTLLKLLQGGFTLQLSGIAKVLQQNTATFIDSWKNTPLLFDESAIFQAAAGYPYFVGEVLESVLMIGSRTSPVWAEHEKKIFP